MVLCAKILAMTGCPVMPATNSALVSLSSLFLKTVVLAHHPLWFSFGSLCLGSLLVSSLEHLGHHGGHVDLARVGACKKMSSKASNRGGKMFTNLDEERHHVEELVNADGAVAVLVEEIEDAEQVVLGLAVAEQVEQHAHAVER